MSVDVLGYLQSKGLRPRRASGDEVHVPCMFCQEPEGKRGRLYVNVNPEADIHGLFHCKICDARGALPTIKRHFGDSTEAAEKEDDSYLRRAILEEAADYYHQALADNEAAFHYLKQDRGLTLETIRAHRLGYADGGLFRHLRSMGHQTEHIVATGLARSDRDTGRMVDFLQGHITIPYLVAGSVVMIRGRAFGGDPTGSKYVTPPGQKSRLFNTDVTWTAKELVVTEGEFDCMVLEQLGFAAVASPGANTWQDTWTGYFSEARRVWVVFDRDDNQVGDQGAERVLAKLGARARAVELPPHDQGKSKNDVTEWIVVCGHTEADFNTLLRSSRGALVTVRDAIEEHNAMQGLAGLRFGLSRLDDMLHPGMLPSQLMIPLAKSGTGKTILLLNLFQRIVETQPDTKILFVSLEQTRGDWWERARRIYRFWHPEHTETQAAAFWEKHLWLDDRNRVTEENLRQVIEDFELEVGCYPHLIAVDYLGYFARGFKGEPYQRTGDAVMALKAIAKDFRVPIIAPHQVSRTTTHGSAPSMDTARDSGVVEETADFVLSLWSNDTTAGRTLAEKTGEFFMQINKSRHGGVGHTEKFHFAPQTLVLVNSTDEPKRIVWAKNELHYAKFGMGDWTQAIIRHVAGTPATEEDWRVVEREYNRRCQRSLQSVI